MTPIVEGLATIFAEIRRRLDAAPPGSSGLVLASVVRSRGSTPRKPGARMVIDPRGGSIGTVGGGCGEAEILGRAQRVLATGEPQLVEVNLLEEDGWESPSICGGILDVAIERLGETIGGVAREDFFAALEEGASRGRGLAVVTVIATVPGGARDGWVGRKTIVDDRGEVAFSFGDAEVDALVADRAATALASGRPLDTELGLPAAIGAGPRPRALRLYVEPLSEPPELVVVGAGHVGTALARMASHAGFSVTVIDDRASFANPVRIPEAHHIVVEDPRRALRDLAPRAGRHVVLVTRGHRLDAECLEVALAGTAAYVGMIGSRRRVGRILEWLGERGVARADLERVHSPIGLDLGAETPGEIAVSILAEIVDRRRGGRGSGLAMRRPPRG